MSDEKTPVYKAVKDTLTLELMKPVLARVRNRIKEIQRASQSVSTKIMKGNTAVWITEEPEMKIASFNASYNPASQIGTLTYQKYKVDSKGNKVSNIVKSKSPYSDREIEVSAEYVLDCLVVETIEKHKPIKVEEVRQ